MKKSILVLIITVLLVFSGCGISNPNQDESKINTNTTVPATTEFKAIEKINHYVLNTDVQKCASSKVKKIYKKLVDAVYKRQEKIYLSKSYDDNLYALIILRSNPAYFVVKETSFFNNHQSIKMYYKYKKPEHDDILNFMDEEYLNILNEIIMPEANELDKVLAVYRYFSSRIEYDYDWLDGLNTTDEKYLYPDISVYEALKTNKGVCHSYSYLCHYAYQQLGINSFCVTGDMLDGSGEHMWLLVEIYGKYYHIDPAWDRGEDEQVGLRYFGLTDEERANDLTIDYYIEIDTNFGEVSCTDTAFSEFHGSDEFGNPDIMDFVFDTKGRMLVTKSHGKDVWFNTDTLKFE